MREIEKRLVSGFIEDNEEMGKLRQTASFHRRLRNCDFFTKRMGYPPSRKNEGGRTERKIKSQSFVEIRDKRTKELVDLEVCSFRHFKYLYTIL